MPKTSSARSKIVETTSKLFQLQGFHATGLNQIVKESKAPKGSLYHYFPGGKEELACEAVRCTRDHIAEGIKESLAKIDDPVLAIQAMIKEMTGSFTHDSCYQGIPVAAVVLETAMSSELIREACQDAYETWCQVFTEKLLNHGFSKERAESLGRLINAMIEGAVIVSITRQDDQVLLDVAEQIPLILSKK
jgi:TetR/AcrR family transcriptional repressor of lmrAB and yxaGH operons